MTLSPLASAQESSSQASSADAPQEQPDNGEENGKAQSRKDYYRAEFVIIERKVDPETLDEQMASRIPEPPSPDIDEILRVVNRDGSSETTLELVPRSDLHLNSAASRLENSGRYRVLLATGWYQSFPPDFEGEPLRVAIGDWLEEAGHREVQGHITIDRQRYLHVDVRLNHWQPLPQGTLTGEDTNESIDGGEEGSSQSTDDADDSIGALATGGDIEDGSRALISGANWPRAELLTWIRETRRMRSEEVHFLDSPTIGVLVFFRKIEE